MKNWKSKSQFQAILLAVCFFNLPISARADSPPSNIEEFRRGILADRIERVVDTREAALRGCKATRVESDLISDFKRLRAEYKSYEVSGVTGLLSLMNAYALTSQIEKTKTACGKKITAADLKLAAADRKKFNGVRTVAKVFSPSLYPISLSELIFMELDPWCASGVQANFNGKRDGNPCFAGELPILSALRDVANKTGATYFNSSMEVDGFLARLSSAASSGAMVIDFDRFFSSKADRRMQLAIVAYLYGAGTSELGWVDGFGEAFWRSSLDQGTSALASLGQYLSWLNRKDQFVVLRKQLKAKQVQFRFFGREVEGWNHHEFLAAFLACNYAARGSQALARTVPEALGIAYEGRDFISHLKGEVGVYSSAKNFVTDVRRHKQGGRFGRLACTPRS